MARWLKTYAGAALLAVATLLFYEFIPWAAVKREEWPAWVQAVGSIIAIGIAILVPYWQQKKARQSAAADEAQTVRQMLRSLRDEIRAVSESFGHRNGKLLIESEPGSFFNVTFPFVDRPFPIYDAAVARLGQVPNDELRRLIIIGYAHAMSFVATARFNNLLVQQYDHAHHEAEVYNDAPYIAQREKRLLTGTKYGDQLREAYRGARAVTAELLVALETEIGCD
jgi:type II secretory pathway pseudopilin PulG